MVTEIELKYSVLANNELSTNQQIKAVICQLLSAHDIDFSHQKKQLSNHYFDTANLALRKQKIALRTRGTKHAQQLERFEQTIKTSGSVIAGLHQRPEYNVDLSDAKPILSLFPQSLWQKNSDVNEFQQQIIELFVTNFTRHTWLITLANATVELAFDSGEIVCENHPNKPAIYEIELELVSGETEALFFLTKLLFGVLALRPGQLTKAARGYALYKESQSQQAELKAVMPLTPSKKTDTKALVPLVQVVLSEDNKLNDAFKEGVDFSLTQLQLSVDSYVETQSLNGLSQIRELLTLIRQGFWLFNGLLTDEAVTLRSELSYFIGTLHWVDTAHYLQSLKKQSNSHAPEKTINQELITKLELAEERYPSETEVLTLLHSERFNNLQLALLSLLLNESKYYQHSSVKPMPLIDFARKQLTQTDLLFRDELAQLSQAKDFLVSEHHLTVHRLLVRKLLTNSWFSCLFTNKDDKRVNECAITCLDIKQSISELQTWYLFRQQLTSAANAEQNVRDLIAAKSDSLLSTIETYSTKNLLIKPYWS